MTAITPCVALIKQWRENHTTIKDDSAFKALDANQRSYVLSALANIQVDFQE